MKDATSNDRSEREKQYDLEERLLDYSAAIVRLVERLPSTRAGNHVAGQLLRSGTSPFPNHGEGQAAESVDDFVHKFRVCLKEFRESRRWLLLILRVPMIRETDDAKTLLAETEELIKIFFSSIRTAQRNNQQERNAQRPTFNAQRSTFNKKRSPIER